MTRSDCIRYARGLYHPARVTADTVREDGVTKRVVTVSGFRVAAGLSWAECYGDLRQGLAWREMDAENEKLRAAYTEAPPAGTVVTAQVAADGTELPA